ncbi:MAG: tetratricopeptide repeat protein [Vampirovibrionales bacterium]|nr:tetratricopeptide repeat protein [Vampirovibrionales bacterium]
MGAAIFVLLMAPSMAEDAGDLERSLETLELQNLGRSTPQAPLGDRLNALEVKLGQAPKPGGSVDYRVAQLYAAHQAQVSDQAKRLAVQAYNRGVDAEAARRTDEAITAYREALRYNPGLIQAANNLGGALEAKKEYEAALAVYRQAIAWSPAEPLLYRNLGVACENVGRVEEALKAYETYLKLSPNPDPPIRAIVDNYRKNRALGLASADYYTALDVRDEGRHVFWGKPGEPVRFYVEITAPQLAQFVPLIHEGMRSWEQATSGRIRFAEVGDPMQANLIVRMIRGPMAHPTMEVGHTEFTVNSRPWEREERSRTVTITLKLGDAHDDALPWADRQESARRFALHELGHAIGLWGHSPDPGDVMYTHPIVSQLSARDIATIRKVYALPAGKASGEPFQ